jgi:two-component system, OmpR family, sensor histidine kinase BaeS
MFRTLQGRFFLFALFLSLGAVLLTGIFMYVGIERSFGSYVGERQEQQAEETAAQLENAYEGSWETVDMQLLQGAGMHEGMRYTLYTIEGEVIFSSHSMMHHGGMNTESGEAVTYELERGGEPIGRLEVVYPDQFVGAEQDFFQQTLLFLGSSLLAVIMLSALLSRFFSHRLTEGIRSIGSYVQSLKDKNRPSELFSSYKVEELDTLSSGVNELALALEREEKKRRQFTGDMAHELRTPLSTLRSQLEAFQDGVLEPTSERLNQSYMELMRLVRLVDEMERLHEAENQHHRLELEKLDAQEMIEGLVSQFQPSFEDKGVKLTFVSPPVSFTADRDRWMQIMTNLLHNAWKFTSPGSHVHVEAVDLGEEVEFQIIDEGKGMSDREMEHMYDRFFRGEKSRNRERGGLGIGLAIVRALVEAHNGTINIESIKGAGTTVKVRLKK